MKKIIPLLLALFLIASALPTLAEGADIRMDLPQEIEAFFSAKQFSGATIYPDSFAVFENTPGGDIAFAVLSKGATHVLYGFEKKNGAWVYWLKNGSVLPQVEGRYLLDNIKGSYEPYTDQLYTQDTLWIALHSEEYSDYWEYVSCFSVNDKGQWHLVKLSTYQADEKRHMAARVYTDHIAYYSENTFLGHAWGVVETNLRYVNFSAFPATLEKAREVLSTPPDIPSGSQLSATEIQFTGGQKYAVYSGPGKEYERAANGKAMVSTNDWIQVFGEENGYILIQYDLSAEQMRFGYIPVSALPKGASVSSLALEKQEATILHSTFLTDDPLKSQTSIRTLSAEQSGVTYLASMGAWAYVEMKGSGAPIRGFVPASAVSCQNDVQTYTASYAGSDYFVQAHAEISPDASLTVSLTLQGPLSWMENPQEMIQRYQLYANHISVSAAFTGQAFSTEHHYGALFTLNASLPDHTTLIGLCPVYADGIHADETILLPLQ